MNPIADHLPPPPPLLQPPRSSFSCDRHPDETFSGFCPLCLCERLTTLDQTSNHSANASSSSRRNSTSSATAAIRSLFKLPSSSNNTLESYRNKAAAVSTATTKNSLFPELRRTKSFSASKAEGLGFFAGVFEPQRKSCDVRGRNTNALSTLFSIDDESKPRISSARKQTLGNTGTVLETNREDENEEDRFHEEEIKRCKQQEEVDVNDSENEIVEEIAEIETEIEEEGEEDDVKNLEELKTMQDHLDLDSQTKKQSRSNFWSAASVLGKKWQKWRGKQKKSTVTGDGIFSSSRLPVEKPISRQYRETRSEIADYGYGRRSCDIDPRFSLDACRISFDDARQSYDEPRASWDGYVIGRTFPRLPPMVEDVKPPRSDMQISVEKPENTNDLTDLIPGGSIQTREYYTDSSSKRRKSLDRSNSIRKMAEMEETQPAINQVSNAKVSPATIDYSYNYGNVRLRFSSIGGEGELRRDSNSTSLRDDCSEIYESGLRENAVEDVKKQKPRRWKWKLWGFKNRGGGNKDDEEDVFSRGNGVGRSYSESWQESGINNRLFRSNSTVSCRHSSYTAKNLNRRNGGDECGLERNRSVKYSPNHADSGLLRFYLTPLRGSRRSKPNPSSRNMNRL